MYLSLRLWSKNFKSHCHPSIKEAQQSLGHRVRLGLTLALAGVGGSGKEAPSRGARWGLGLRLRRARTPPNPRVQKQRFSKPVAVMRVRERTFVIDCWESYPEIHGQGHEHRAHFPTNKSPFPRWKPGLQLEALWTCLSTTRAVSHLWLRAIVMWLVPKELCSKCKVHSKFTRM